MDWSTILNGKLPNSHTSRYSVPQLELSVPSCDYLNLPPLLPFLLETLLNTRDTAGEGDLFSLPFPLPYPHAALCSLRSNSRLTFHFAQILLLNKGSKSRQKREGDRSERESPSPASTPLYKGIPNEKGSKGGTFLKFALHQGLAFVSSNIRAQLD